MGNALSMALRVRFKTLMDCGLCAAGQESPRRRASGTAAVGAAQGQRQTGAVCCVLRGTDRAGSGHYSGRVAGRPIGRPWREFLNERH